MLVALPRHSSRVPGLILNLFRQLQSIHKVIMYRKEKVKQNGHNITKAFIYEAFMN